MCVWGGGGGGGGGGIAKPITTRIHFSLQPQKKKKKKKKKDKKDTVQKTDTFNISQWNMITKQNLTEKCNNKYR